jgi:hypothetical protein
MTIKSGLPPISIVVVNYNSGRYLTNCVESILESTYSKKKVVVVDNASQDESVGKMLNKYPQVKVVLNQSNVGYAAAGNVGIKSTKGSFVVIMNPDTLVEPTWLEELVKATQRFPRGAFFQPKILLMDNPRILNSAGNLIHIAGFGICRGLGALDSEEFQKESDVCYVSGACTLIRREALREIGPLEELFFAYGEDKDWGWRASMMGWQSVYVPSARILHKWSLTLGRTPNKFYLLEFERLLSFVKNYSKRTLLLLMPVFFIVELWVMCHAIVNGWFLEKIQSYVDLFGARTLVLQKRRIIQKHRAVSDRVLIRRFVATIEHPYLGPAAGVLNRLTSRIHALVANSI